MPEILLEQILDSGDDAIFQTPTHAAGPSGSLPISAEMLPPDDCITRK